MKKMDHILLLIILDHKQISRLTWLFKNEYAIKKEMKRSANYKYQEDLIEEKKQLTCRR